MDHTDSTHPNPKPTRPSLRIDLNETPYSSSSESPTIDVLSLVRSYHDRLSPPDGAPVKLPGDLSDCVACRLPIAEGRLLVCDGCELGFHLDCAEMQGQKVAHDEWLCGNCVSNAVPCNRWSLGLKTNAKGKKRGRSSGLDMDVMPRSDGEGEDLQFSRKLNPCGNTFGGNPFAVPVSKLFYFGKGFQLQAASNLVCRSVKLGSEELIQRKESGRHSLAEFDVCSPKETIRTPSNIRPLPHMRNKMYLESLREFICRSGGGVLQEGWSVELKSSKIKVEPDVLYCAPDGKKFESMSEVAYYVGLTPNVDNTECGGKSYESDPSWIGSLQPKRRKTARLAATNCAAESQEIMMRDSYANQFSDIHNIDIIGESVNCAKLTAAASEETSGSSSREFNDGLPVQYEDFCILSVGKIDPRPYYHNANEIWPIGYKSCWHDRITGSLFMCDVLDGGDSGPVFKVKRSPCSILPIPVGSTVLYKRNLSLHACQHEGNRSNMTCTDEDYSVVMMLSEPSPPNEHDVLFCLGTSVCSNDQTSKGRLLEDSPCDGKSGNEFLDSKMMGDVIGEFTIEESSSSSAWRIVSEKVISACQKVFTETGTVRYFCKHSAEMMDSCTWDITNQKVEEVVDPLSKFCCSSELTDTPIFRNPKALEVSCESLLKWLDQDRFGLDVEFVQELLEQCPGAIACHEYVFLKDRKTYPSSFTIGNGFLLARTKDGVDLTNEKPLDDSTDSCQTSKIPKVKYHLSDNHFIPPGKPVSSRLHPQILSNALQVWEFLCRFHDVLELSEPFSFKELEKELISPWFDTSNEVVFERGFKECVEISSLKTVITESDPAVSDKDPHAFMPVETLEMKEEAQAKLASITRGRCNGFVLTKIHSSVIRVLISELQLKVTAIADPTFDTGELKSKRGRKKDTDSWITAIRSKVDTLPVNELTWPELVRRYVLSIVSMGGKLDCADITPRETGILFRCLHGDGGVLCGSPTGVAGIEADAVFLAEAVHNIFGTLNRKHDMIAIEDVISLEDIQESMGADDGNLPDWAKALEPVRKLPTNVGARIRKCINEALHKNPPDWAKKVLEHSISKGVYKGNASGPTKKAVLSVLADLHKQQQPQKEQKEKRLVSISEIIMKRSRNVLRLVAAADDAKIFCNLLGGKFMNHSDGDDEGFLGSPAMVSRPLDIRTIDLKLAAGAYGGSHEAFLEDVKEFWANVRIAYKDQPDLIKLVETLSHNFDLLYEKEVLFQFQKLMEYRNSECLSAESKTEIDQMLDSEILKAPWEEGVCKVCGIDRDDDNVLLCDKCDAEYHKYCLNPPLTKIPEGNWYCPSCVTGKCITQGAPDTRSDFLHNMKCQGEFTRAHLDFLARLASDMAKFEYWELGESQRTCLLTFLCDEVLSSVLVRQHIEQCAEASPVLMQSLRFISAELKTLKHKEASLEGKAVKAERSFNLFGDHTEKDRVNQYSSKSKSDCIKKNSGDLSQLHIDHTGAAFYPPDLASSGDLQGLSASLARGSGNAGMSDPSKFLNHSPSDSPELTSVRTEILQLKNKIACIESQLMKLSVRREFLGKDSSGRLYWVLRDSGTRPSSISGGNVEMHRSGQIISVGFPEHTSARTYAAGSLDALRTSGRSRPSTPCPFEIGDSNACWTWVSYKSDAEIKKLVDHLKDNNPREKELKESVLQWDKSRIQGIRESESEGEGPQMTSSSSIDGKKFVPSNLPSTIATSLLEDKFGPCLEPESSDLSNRRFKKAKGVEHKMFRCECLEPVWSSRHHCRSCHKTFLNNVELDRHNDVKCATAPPEKSTFIRHQNDKSICPFDFEDICSRFKISGSNKELVREIGLLGSNGIPTFVPSSPQETVVVQADKLNTDVQDKMKSSAGNSNTVPDSSFQSAVEHQDRKRSFNCCAPLCKVGNGCIVPEPSLRPLIGKTYYILRQLKMNLLDIDAALPEGAVRPSKGKLEQRWAWRCFVKSAERIYEMAQATIVLEDMIKSEYLMNKWWYWSSLTTAAKISTLSALALRIHSLDAAIYYSKPSCSDTLQKMT